MVNREHINAHVVERQLPACPTVRRVESGDDRGTSDVGERGQGLERREA